MRAPILGNRRTIALAFALATVTLSRDSRAQYGAEVPMVAVFFAPVPVLDLVVIGLDIRSAVTGRPLSRAWAWWELSLGVSSVLVGIIPAAIAFDQRSKDGPSVAPWVGLSVGLLTVGGWLIGHSIWTLALHAPPPSKPAPQTDGASVPTPRTPTWSNAFERTTPPTSPYLVPLYSGVF